MTALAHKLEVPLAVPAGSPVPLILDLDHSLIQSDLLWESALRFVRLKPWNVITLLLWLCQGRAILKSKLAHAVCLDMALLPVNESLVAFAAREHEQARPVHLATAANELFAHQIAEKFTFLDRIFASDAGSNLKGDAKAKKLTENFPSGFIYAGDSRSDLPVWRAATDIVVTNASASVEREARSIREPVFTTQRPDRLRAAGKLLRLHQWAKNALVFVPLILGGGVTEPTALLSTLLAFLGLSLTASGTYVVNDLLDLDDDRRHWTKCKRPLASGALPIPHGIALGLVALASGLVLAAMAGATTLLGVCLYLGVTLSYSLKFKRVPIVDVMVLAGLFTLRLIVGAAAAHIPASPWLLTFSMFLFLSLALAKRHTEIARAASNGKKASGRGYVKEDEPIVLGLGVGSLVASILVFVLYLTQEAFVAAHLASPKLLWMFPPALFLLASRIWLLSGRGDLNDDPVAFAVKDNTSLMIIGSLGVVVGLAWIGTGWIGMSL